MRYVCISVGVRWCLVALQDIFQYRMNPVKTDGMKSMSWYEYLLMGGEDTVERLYRLFPAKQQKDEVSLKQFCDYNC